MLNLIQSSHEKSHPYKGGIFYYIGMLLYIRYKMQVFYTLF